MRIVRAHGFGGPEQLMVEEIEAPQPGPGQVRIAVEAASVNPVDWKLLTGKAPVNPPLPLVPGGDVAGIIEAVGPDAGGWKVGDSVMALLGLTGAYAEAVVTDAAYIAPLPKGLSHAEAAGLPLVALTAWQGFAADGRALASLHVLVHNGAGGVGNAAIQIAKARGARVTATASEANAAFVRDLGADVVVDFRSTRIEGRARDVDILLDLVGNSRETGMWALVRDGGSVIRIAGGADAPANAEEDGVRAYKVRVRPDGAQLKEIGGLAERGLVRTVIAATYALADAAQALAHSKSGHVRGKIVLVPDGTA